MTQQADPGTDTGTLTLQQFTRESGLDSELVTVFLSSTHSDAGPVYRRSELGIAQVVKNMADSGAPAMTIHAAVKDLEGRTPMEIESLGAATAPWQRAQRRRRHTLTLAVAAASLVGIGIGVGAGQLVHQDTVTQTAVQTLTVSGPPAQLTPTVPSGRDPVCGEWEQTTRSYGTRRERWSRIDAKLAAAQWDAAQRATAQAVRTVMQGEAQDMRALANRAENPFLRVLVRAHAVYEDAFAEQLPDYRPDRDAHLWRGVQSFIDAVAVVCTTPPQ